MRRECVARKAVSDKDLVSSARKMVDVIDSGWWSDDVLQHMRRFFVNQMLWTRMLAEYDAGHTEAELERIFAEGVARLDRRMGGGR